MLGFWDPPAGTIVIRRDQLRALPAFAGTLLPERTHAKTGTDDVSTDFEDALTEIPGLVAARLV